MIDKSNVNHQIMIFNLNIMKKNYNINLRTLNYALLIINSYKTQFVEQIKNLKQKLHFFLNFSFFFNLFLISSLLFL